MDKKFIVTKDKEVAKQLLVHYKLVSKSQNDDMWVFENNPDVYCFDFSNIRGKVAFSNKLLF